MKLLYSILAALACCVGLHAGDIYEGVVVDMMQGGGYTYLQIDDTKKRYWIAVEGVSLDKGTEVRFQEEMKAKNFESKALGRTFDELVFASNLQYRTHVQEAGNLALINAYVEVSPYRQNGTLSVKEAWEQRTQLSGKSVTIRGKVVKASSAILGRNWIHIQDGTGENREVGRIVFTSQESPKVGDIVTATGIVAVDKNFGSGYIYKIIVENATFTK
ncbi:hypothetical protein [Sulfurospirillum cavolei]|uniref:hypothetical protein n=1 Tax=Sulfurospirillum cavolei TaxID=366522 RepID=UPI0005AA63F0|nr:hypothetical protein [Sulfurospirillum cavolei]